MVDSIVQSIRGTSSTSPSTLDVLPHSISAKDPLPSISPFALDAQGSFTLSLPLAPTHAPFTSSSFAPSFGPEVDKGVPQSPELQAARQRATSASVSNDRICVREINDAVEIAAATSGISIGVGFWLKNTVKGEPVEWIPGKSQNLGLEGLIGGKFVGFLL
ncbi:hypothetical protein U1Q18_010560 [Sarracenia purpurea var. burkii]